MVPATVAACVVALAGVASGASGARVTTGRSCYLRNQTVFFKGTGFAPSRSYTVSVDGVDFGTSTTSSSGAASNSLIPGLGGGFAQVVDHLAVTDGTTAAQTTFTVTQRRPGARFLAASGAARTLRAPFEVWSFALNGSRPLPVYLHYVSPAGTVRATVLLGDAGGQCGYLLTPPRRVFPFVPSRGSWTLQVDTQSAYSSRPSGPVARIGVGIS